MWFLAGTESPASSPVSASPFLGGRNRRKECSPGSLGESRKKNAGFRHERRSIFLVIELMGDRLANFRSEHHRLRLPFVLSSMRTDWSRTPLEVFHANE